MAVVSATPRVASMTPWPSTGLISVYLVSIPPEKQDDTQSNHTDELRSMRIIELYSQAVATE